MKATADQWPTVLLSTTVDLHLQEPKLDYGEQEEMTARFVPEGFPVVIALVDTFCSKERLECMTNALVASLNALHPATLLGIISFDDHVRVYDMTGSAPRCRSMTLLDGVPLLASLEDILPLEQFLAPVGKHKDVILATLESIECISDFSPHSVGHETDAPVQPSVSRTDVEAPQRSQAYGTVVQALLQYLKPLECAKEEKESKGGSTVICARILSFLAGPPTMGLGSLAPYMTSKEYFQNKDSKGDAAKELEKASASAAEFYNQTALVAASLGVVLDLFLLPSQPMCLEIMSSFSILTGGDMWLYESVSDALLTEDLVRHLSTLHAQTCLMRLRLPPQLSVSKSYGRLMRDPLYDDLYHILCCDPYETFSLDLEHQEELVDPVTLQVAFQYDAPVFVKMEQGTTHFEMQKRLRIATVQIDVSQTPMVIYENVKAEVVLNFLMHKVLVAIKAEGTMKAAVLLQDWLIILAASYMRDAEEGSHSKSFVECEFFQPLIHLVYGLLRSPLLLGKHVERNDDRSIFVQHLWQSLQPSDLQRAVYPSLMSFWSLDDKASANHSLSRMAMKISQAPGFLMDAYDTIILFFMSASEMPCPPLPSTGIRQSIKELQENRKRLPRYLTIKEDDPTAEIFLEKLLDEPKQLKKPLEGESAVAFNGYLQFVDWIKYASEEYQSRKVS